MTEQQTETTYDWPTQYLTTWYLRLDDSRRIQARRATRVHLAEWLAYDLEVSDHIRDRFNALTPYMTDDHITVAQAVELYRRDHETTT